MRLSEVPTPADVMEGAQNAFRHGYVAGHEGLPESDAPLAYSLPQLTAWSRGWLRGKGARIRTRIDAETVARRIFEK